MFLTYIKVFTPTLVDSIFSHLSSFLTLKRKNRFKKAFHDCCQKSIILNVQNIHSIEFIIKIYTIIITNECIKMLNCNF